jgi:hypothetical protein
VSTASIGRRLARVEAERATTAATAARAACDRWVDTLTEIAPTPEEWAANDASHAPEVRQMGALITAATGVLYDRQATPEALHRALAPLAPYLLDDDTGEAVAGAADWQILAGLARFYEDDRRHAETWAATHRGRGEP